MVHAQKCIVCIQIKKTMLNYSPFCTNLFQSCVIRMVGKFCKGAHFYFYATVSLRGQVNNETCTLFILDYDGVKL